MPRPGDGRPKIKPPGKLGSGGGLTRPPDKNGNGGRPILQGDLKQDPATAKDRDAKNKADVADLKAEFGKRKPKPKGLTVTKSDSVKAVAAASAAAKTGGGKDKPGKRIGGTKFSGLTPPGRFEDKGKGLG